MSNSSQPNNSSNDLFSETIVIGDSTITFTTPHSSTGDIYIDTTANMNYNISTDINGTYTIMSDTISINSDYNFNWGDAEEFVDSFPDWQRIQDMCKKYPGLEIALRNFRTVYTLVKDDYDNPKDEN